MMQILCLLGMYFDAIYFRLALAILWGLRNCTPHTLKVGKSQIIFSWLQFFQKMTENSLPYPLK